MITLGEVCQGEPSGGCNSGMIWHPNECACVGSIERKSIWVTPSAWPVAAVYIAVGNPALAIGVLASIAGLTAYLLTKHKS